MVLLPTVAAGQTGQIANTNQVHKRGNQRVVDVKADYSATRDGSTNDRAIAPAVSAAISIDWGVPCLRKGDPIAPPYS